MKKSILFIALALVCSLSAKAEEKEVSCGSTVTITATANPGYHFVQWNDGVTDASRTVTVDEAKSFTATFAHDDVTIAFEVEGDGKVVDKNGAQLTSVTIAYDSTIVVTAVPTDDCYKFDRWEDGETANPRSIKASEASASYKAIFVKKQFKVTATSNNDNWGTVTIAEN